MKRNFNESKRLREEAERVSKLLEEALKARDTISPNKPPKEETTGEKKEE